METIEEVYNEEEIAFQIILHAGNAKSLSMEALKVAREEGFEKAEDLFVEAGEELRLAHECQTDVLRKSLVTDGIKVGLLMIHAQDHLMNAITINDLSKEIVNITKSK